MKRTLLIFGLLSAMVIGCGESPETAEKQPATVETYTDKSLVGANVEQQLEQALDNERTIFLVLVGKNEQASAKAIDFAENARRKITGSVVVKMNRDDKAHEETVGLWDLAGIELPAIVVISAKGIPVGGYTLADVNTQKLVELIPSPKMDDAYVALYDEKAVFLVISESGAADRQQAVANCEMASKELKGKAAVIEVDKTDQHELLLLKNFGLTASSKGTVVVVMNAAGETTDTYKTVPTVQQLTASATKKGKTACCGAGESCETPQ